MDKILFINELCNVSGDPIECRNNIDLCMNNSTAIDIFYEALKIIASEHGAINETIVSPVDFNTFTVPPGEFRFAFSSKVKSVISCPHAIQLNNGVVCIVDQNEDSQGYILRISSIKE